MDLQVEDASSIRSLARIFNYAAKTSDNLQFTPNPSLHIRVLGPSQSTFASFHLHQTFCVSATLSVPIKVPVRPLLPPFRTPQNIKILHLHASNPPTSLRITITTRTNTIKRFRIPLIPGRVPSIHTPSNPTCHLRTTPRLLLDILANFHAHLDELSLIPAPDYLKLVSYVDDAANPANVILRTEMTVAAAELHEHIFPSSHPITLTVFCKSLRALLDFCDPFDTPLSMQYHAAGKPVVFDISVTPPPGDTGFRAIFVLASRLTDDVPPAHGQPRHRSFHTQLQPKPAEPVSRPQDTQMAIEPTPQSRRYTPQHVVPESSARITPPVLETTMRRTASREPSQNHPLPVMDPSPQKRGSYAMGSSEVDGTPGPLSLPRFDEFDREPRAELDDEGDDDDDFVDGTPPP